MKFYTAIAIFAVATTSAVKLNEKVEVQEQTLVQEQAASTLSNEIQELGDQIDAINSQLEARVKSHGQADAMTKLEERMDQLEKNMFDFGKTLGRVQGYANKYVSPYLKKFGF